MAYVTAPGERVTSVVTDRGHPAPTRRAAAGGGGAGRDGPLAERVRAMVAACGWEPEVAATVEELDPVTEAEVLALREFDRERLFLR